ncbi:GDP-mannose 4,6-dehydratase [bacterium]|nr:GDP-mannose 4,6-dehydratase [bacterium]
MRVLVTGGAGFIGSHITDALLARGDSVTVLDNFDDSYDPEIKRRNLAQARQHDRFTLITADIRDTELVNEQFTRNNLDGVIHLAALAGVRESLDKPALFNDVNVGGTLALLEAAKDFGKPRFILASTSSVYGSSPAIPSSEDDPLLHVLSPYGATKIACEKLGHIYHVVHGLELVSLRFFTVYGPRQRPDMAIHRFVQAVLEGQEITLYGDGRSSRDYTYIDDIVQGVIAALDSSLPYGIMNLGNNQTCELMELVRLIEDACGKKAVILHLPEQPGDPQTTCADISRAQALLGYEPRMSISEGIRRFIEWFAASKVKLRQ